MSNDDLPDQRSHGSWWQPGAIRSLWKTKRPYKGPATTAPTRAVDITTRRTVLPTPTRAATPLLRPAAFDIAAAIPCPRFDNGPDHMADAGPLAQPPAQRHSKRAPVMRSASPRTRTSGRPFVGMDSPPLAVAGLLEGGGALSGRGLLRSCALPWQWHIPAPQSLDF
jgi:hypothetical protein